MSVGRFARVLRQGLVASVTALAATTVCAQEESVPVVPEAPAVTPDGPSGRPDAIDAYQVRVADNEYMAGRLRVVDSASGVIRGIRKTNLLFIQNGKVVGRGETGVNGVAQVRSLPLGSYSAVALGPDGMAAFGFEVLPTAEGVSVPAYRFDALIVPASDVTVAQRTICSAGKMAGATPLPLPAPPEPLSPIAVALSRQIDGPITPAPLEDGFDYESADAVAAPLKGQPILVQNGQSGVGQLVVLSADGQPRGLENARVSFIRSGQLLGTIETDSQGYCGIVGLENGTYSMVGVGPNGFIALGVQVQTANDHFTAKTAENVEGRPEFVNFRQPGVPVVEWRTAAASSDALSFAPGFACGTCGQPGCCDQCAADPCGGPCDPGLGGGYGGFGGGGFGGGAGGGGGFFGGGLLGPLLGAGVGAAIGAAIADDDDDDDGGDVIIVSPNAPPN